MARWARCEECLHYDVCEYLEKGNGIMKVSPIHCGCYKNAADVVPKSEVERLEKALAAKDAEYDQALQDKARECNMAIDKICLEHREEIRRLQKLHEEDLANVTRDLAIEIFFRLDNLIKPILLDNGDGTIAAVNTQEYIELKKKYMKN